MKIISNVTGSATFLISQENISVYNNAKSACLHISSGYNNTACSQLIIKSASKNQKPISGKQFSHVLQVLGTTASQNNRNNKKACGGVSCRNPASKLSALVKCDQKKPFSYSAPPTFPSWVSSTVADHVFYVVGKLCSRLHLPPRSESSC